MLRPFLNASQSDYLKAPYSSKIDIFIQERFNKLIYSIYTIIKCGIRQPVKFQLDFHFWTGSKMKWFYFRDTIKIISFYEFLQAVKCHILSSYLYHISIYLNLSCIIKMSVFDEYGAFNWDCWYKFTYWMTYQQTVQIQISWLLQNPTDLDVHCFQRQGISGFSRDFFILPNSIWKQALAFTRSLVHA